MIEEQIQKVISDNNLNNEEITERLNNIDDELSTIKARLEEIDTAYKAADEAIQNSFSSQIVGLRTESQAYTNKAIEDALGQTGGQAQLYEHHIIAKGTFDGREYTFHGFFIDNSASALTSPYSLPDGFEMYAEALRSPDSVIIYLGIGGGQLAVAAAGSNSWSYIQITITDIVKKL